MRLRFGYISTHARNAKRIRVGELVKKAAKHVAQQIQARLALGHTAFESHETGITIDAYVEIFLHRIEQTRKHTTHIVKNKAPQYHPSFSARCEQDCAWANF